MQSPIEGIFSKDSLPPGETNEKNFQHFVSLAEKAKAEAEKGFDGLTQESKQPSRINIGFLFN
ncbi:hypothetical protein KAI54_01720 [Candidatus Gracilibacteria bacterium]|nr:hypothetical protein [Candidatus Gracilibacteria bacterium]